MMSDAIRARIEWFEKTLKGLRGKGFVPTLYHFGYCPECDDITEIRFEKDSDPWAQNPPTFVRCVKCNFVDLKKIKYTGNEIPPKFKKRWDRKNSRTNQIRVHKERMREFLESLGQDCQERVKTHEEASRRLGRFL